MGRRDRRTSVELGARFIKSARWSQGRGKPDVPEIGDRYSAGSDSEMDKGTPRATNLVARPAIRRSEESPQVRNDANNGGSVGVGRATSRWCAKSPYATAIRGPWSRVP